ncbi:CAP domain-containing protein [Solirubrobacter phytolaccae]|uniref:CAP domain-containing protein n=1 Tax=Solirubrobacter phytolaccae TaxID=1404360 RepID=A0A9X3NEM2_9ACTN|nr:CAP domain-containing protein [Solirubrobacter phytolaccae]MDA0184606.1 CAP domain-containing protein [Solirubrobacter phytolaccae]
MTSALLLSLALVDPTVAAVNAERARHRLAPFVQHEVLERSSERFAQRLVRTGRFAHDTRIRVPAGRFTRLGEALAQGEGLSPAAAVRAWMDSPPHRKLLLSTRFTQAGAGAAGSTVRVLHLASAA